MMENMIMDQVLGSALLAKLQAMQNESYDTQQQAAGCLINYLCPSSSLNDMHLPDHTHHDHHALLTQQALYHSMGHPLLPPSSSTPSPQDANAVADYILGNSAFPSIYCKREEKEEEGELMIASSLPSCEALSAGTISKHSFLSANDTHDSSYSVQLLHYGSGGGGGSGRYSPDLSSSYNTPLAEHVQCSINLSPPSSGRYGSQPASAYLASDDFSSLLKQGMKDEGISCLGMDMQESNNAKEASKDALSCIMNAGNPHRALSASSSSTPTSVSTSAALMNCHPNLQASWMAFNDDHYTNPINHPLSSDKLLHRMGNNMATDGDHDGVINASIITPTEKKKKRKRKRSTAHKNIQEMESQRMTHIAVERNRRKQMNEHLRALRLLMPHSYIQRGDQASIVGGTIRFVEELQQVLQALRLQKQIRGYQEYKLMNDNFDDEVGAQVGQLHKDEDSNADESYASTRSCMCNVQVSMITRSTIFVKVLAQKRPHQLLQTLLALSNLCLKVKNLNVTTTELIILFYFNLEMEDDCQLRTSTELAESIQQIFCM